MTDERVTTASWCSLFDSLGARTLAIRLRDCMRDSDSSSSQPWGEADPKLPSGPAEAPDLAKLACMGAHSVPCLHSRVSRCCYMAIIASSAADGPSNKDALAGFACCPGGNRLGKLLPEQGPQAEVASRCWPYALYAPCGSGGVLADVRDLKACAPCAALLLHMPLTLLHGLRQAAVLAPDHFSIAGREQVVVHLVGKDSHALLCSWSVSS